MVVDYKFDLKQDVKIKGLNVEGRIVGYYYGETGIQYQVAYFVRGEKKTTYLYPEDLDDVDGSEEKFGFNK